MDTDIKLTEQLIVAIILNSCLKRLEPYSNNTAYIQKAISISAIRIIRCGNSVAQRLHKDINFDYAKVILYLNEHKNLFTASEIKDIYYFNCDSLIDARQKVQDLIDSCNVDIMTLKQNALI